MASLQSWRGQTIAIFFALFPLGAARAADEIHWTFTGQTSITVDWRGTAAEDFVRHGTAPGTYTDTVTATTPSPLPISSPGPFWEARLTGLLEDTLYYYSVADGPEHTFRTPPPRGGANFTIFAEADIGSTLSYQRMAGVQDLIAADLPHFVLVAGDLTYGNIHGQEAVDRHFNDVMVWSEDAAYMPAWGNHEWAHEVDDDLRNYKGRFDFPNPRTSPAAPAISCCGEDWYWFDYGNVRFIGYPEPWDGSTTWTGWRMEAEILMDEAEADPDMDFIVTFGHRPAYSSGTRACPRVLPGPYTDFGNWLTCMSEGFQRFLSASPSLRDILDGLGATHPKYVLSINGHSHNYERTFARNGVVHVTVGTGGATIGLDNPDCRWIVCPPPSWSAFRAVRTGALKLNFTVTAEGKAGIDGSFICGPASSRDDVSCTVGEVIDSFGIGPNLPPS